MVRRPLPKAPRHVNGDIMHHTMSAVILQQRGPPREPPRMHIVAGKQTLDSTPPAQIIPYIRSDRVVALTVVHVGGGRVGDFFGIGSVRGDGACEQQQSQEFSLPVRFQVHPPNLEDVREELVTNSELQSQELLTDVSTAHVQVHGDGAEGLVPSVQPAAVEHHADEGGVAGGGEVVVTDQVHVIVVSGGDGGGGGGGTGM